MGLLHRERPQGARIDAPAHGGTGIEADYGGRDGAR
jgi:hypothetical protein